MQIKKTNKELDMDEEARRNHMAKLLFQRNGRTFATYHDPGEIIRFQDGKQYRVADDGSLRRIKEQPRMARRG